MIEPEDFIFVNDWPSVAHPEVLCGATEGVCDLFELAGQSGRRRVVLTSASDLYLTEQASEHPNDDLRKMAVATRWDDACAVRGLYVGVPVGPCCDASKCRESDTYSLKTERWTWLTLPSVPEEVVWYSTNVNATHPRVRLIPFGLNDHGEGARILPDFLGREKTNWLYVNFQDNTLERVHLKNHYSQQSWVTFRPRADLPVSRYLGELARHAFVLSPAGNGPDCYRIWESIYLGCFPVLSASVFSLALERMGLPVVVVPDLFSLTESFLEEKLDELSRREFDLRPARKSYWRDVLAEEVSRLDPECLP